MDAAYELVLQRKRERLFTKTPLKGQGLEIGPLGRPLVLKSSEEVKYVDHCSTEELIKKYPSTDQHISGICHVDLIWKDETLIKVNSHTRVDYIVASHVIEHVPDPVGWLSEIFETLLEEGYLYLIIPDKRFTFDAFRSLNSLQQFRENAKNALKNTDWRVIVDHFANVRKIDTWQAWDDYESINYSEPHHNLEELTKVLKDFEDGKYIDVHANVFTPWSFFEFIQLCQNEFSVNFKLVNFLTTQDHDLEFYVVLQKISNYVQDWQSMAFSALENALWPENFDKYRYTAQ